ncbi:type IV secretion system protein [Legionella pneumophila serogroup 1]
MDIPSYTTFIISLNTKIDFATKSFIAHGYEILANYLKVPVASMCILLLVLTGYGMMYGFVELSRKTFMKIAFTIGAVYTLAFGWANFNAYFIGLFLDTANEISGILVQGKTFHFPFLHGTGSGLNAALQTVLIEAVKVGGWVMSKGGFTDWLPFFIGLCFMTGGTLVVGLATVEVIVVKLYLAMLLAVGPFFLACLIFPQTKHLFDGWLTQLKGFALALILLGVSVGLCMYLMHWVVGGFFVQKAIGVKLYSVVPVGIASILCLILLLGIIPIAKQIAGTMGGSGWSAVGGAVGGMAGSMMSAGMMSAKGSKSALMLGAQSYSKLTNAGQQIVDKSRTASQIFSQIRKQTQQGR